MDIMTAQTLYYTMYEKCNKTIHGTPTIHSLEEPTQATIEEISDTPIIDQILREPSSYLHRILWS